MKTYFSSKESNVLCLTINAEQAIRMQFLAAVALLSISLIYTLKSLFNESRFNEIPRFIEQLPAPLNYFNIVNSIRFSEQYWSDGPCSLNRDLPLKVARTRMSVKSMQKLL